MRFRVNIKYSLISEPPNLPVAKAIDVRRNSVEWGWFSRRGAERQRAQRFVIDMSIRIAAKNAKSAEL